MLSPIELPMSNVRNFGAVGDGKTDDTIAIMHAVREGDGVLEFPPGSFLLTRTVRLELANRPNFALVGSAGTAKLIAATEGPAFHLVGTHAKTAAPADFQPDYWSRQRMPTVQGIEIEGRHPNADGFLLEGTMQATFEGALLRTLRHGIRLHRRARNLLVSHCHIYDNRGVGVFLDRVNLHQAIITGSHISYCKQGGIGIVGSEIRNLQIVGNDIEYNYHANVPGAADVWIDARADNASVREGTIVGNTIQARQSPGGANVRIVGKSATENHRAGMFTISDNLIGSQEVNIHLDACRGVVVSGNVLYSAARRNLLIEGSRNIVVGPHSIDHNPDYKEKELCTGVRIADSRDVSLTGLMIHDCQAGKHTVAGVPPIQRDGLLELVGCKGVNVNGVLCLTARDGYVRRSCRDVLVSGCTLRTAKQSATPRWVGAGSEWPMSCRIGKGREGSAVVDAAAGVRTLRIDPGSR